MSITPQRHNLTSWTESCYKQTLESGGPLLRFMGSCVLKRNWARDRCVKRTPKEESWLEVRGRLDI